jgi:hypothetical protein
VTVVAGDHTSEHLASRVEQALRSAREVRVVRPVGSRARGDATALSDWDFRVVVSDFAAVAAQLPELVAPLSPLAAQWDRLSEEQCYMLLLRGPHKVDLIFDEPHTDEPPWVVAPETLQAIDAHFWDWILWLAAKRLAGKDDLVTAELSKMHDHLLAPMGISAAPGSLDEALALYVAARSSLEQQLAVHVSRAVEREVLPAITSHEPRR